MDDRQLDNLMNNGKKQADSFFSHADYSPAGNAVHARICKGKKPKPLWSFAMKAGAVAAGMLCLIGITLAVAFGAADTDATPAPVASQTVSLGGEGKDCLINYFPVSAPEINESSLVSVLWELGESTRMMYSTMFERCDEPYPASSMEFPGTSDTIILILSGDSAENFINYRLLGYGSDAVKVWREQDFVPGGSLEILDGVIVERRIMVKEAGMTVSHIVPYEILATGELMLPVNDLDIRLGEQILLVGGDCEGPLLVTLKNGLLEEVKQDNEASVQELAYRATEIGRDLMLLKGQSTGNGYLNVNITE